MSMLSPAPATSSVSGVKSSLRSPTSRESSVLARPAEDGRKLSRKEVRSGRLALSSSQGKEAAVSSASASWPPALEKRGLSGHAGVLVVGGVRRLVRVRPGQRRHGARPGAGGVNNIFSCFRDNITKKVQWSQTDAGWDR